MGALAVYAAMVEEAHKDGERGLLIAALANLYKLADDIAVTLGADDRIAIKEWNQPGLLPTWDEEQQRYIEEVDADLNQEDEQ